ncbi:MAG: hypothetical protein H6544_01085 [Prevotellaceae bacterium]|nr:hypothetical protein [Prevotellaceae bacterium]
MTTVSCSNNSENNQQLNVKDAASWMDKQGIEYKALECFNWVANDDSAPMAKVRISRTKDALVIDYHVAEYSTCGLENTDGGEVYKDACMECFIKAPEDSGYYNIECNCIGTLYIGYRKPGSDKAAPIRSTLSTGLPA